MQRLGRLIKRGQMNKDLSEIIVVVDRSASMKGVIKEAISGYNDFLKKQQECSHGKCLWTLILFNTSYVVQYDGVPVNDVPFLDENTFFPSGMTALYDAVGLAIDRVGERLARAKEEDRPVDVTVVTVEALGPETVLIVSLPDGKEIAARLGRAFSAPIGSRLRLYANLNLMHLFEKESGQVIPVPRR